MGKKEPRSMVRKYLKIIIKRKAAIDKLQDYRYISGPSMLRLDGERYGLDFAARLANSMFTKGKG